MRELDTLSVMILDDVEELIRKINTIKNTKGNISTDEATINSMLVQAKLLRVTAISSIDEVRTLRRELV